MSAAVSLATWQERRADESTRSALAARLAREEQWQQQRYKAAADLAALIELRQRQIDNLRAQVR